MLREAIIEYTKSVDLQPLQDLAAVKVTIVVCESEEMQRMIGRFYKTKGNCHGFNAGYSDSQWRQLHGTVKTKLNQINIPDSVIDVVMENLWPISFEIFSWIRHHVEAAGIDLSPTFCWTPKNTMDYEKTAEILVKNEVLDIRNRYKLSCIYCLESDIRSLWEQMSLLEKRSFFVRGNLKNSSQNPIVLYWTYYIQEVPIDYWSSEVLNHKLLFEYSSENGYLCATKFFLGRLKPNIGTRLSFVYLHNLFYKMRFSENVTKDHLAIAGFFICHLSSDYEGTVGNALGFRYFLEWPFQKHLMAVVNQTRQYMTTSIFVELLNSIFDKEITGFKDYNYKKLFKEFWHRSPEEYKIYTRAASMVGVRILMQFVKKHFGFVFEENSLELKMRFRTIVLQQEIPSDATRSEKENVDFFKFLVRERLARKELIPDSTHRQLMHLLYFKRVVEFFDLPLDELNFLVDGILGNV